MNDNLTWWVRDAANSICGQTGAKTHQEKLLMATEVLDWSADLYAAFCQSATNDQQREALDGYAAASNRAHQ